MIGRILSWLANRGLDHALGQIDRRASTESEREKARGVVLAEYYRSRPSFMKAGGAIMMAAFVAPLAFWWGAVCIYSVLWCGDCAFPQSWTIAALPAPLDEWAGWIVLSLFGIWGYSKVK